MPNPESPAGSDVKPESSTGTQPESTAQATAAAPAASADSPAAAAPAGEQQQPKTVLEAVLAGIEKGKQQPQAGEKPPVAPAEGEQPAGTENDAGVQPAAGDNRPPKDANTRIRELNGYVKRLEPKARYFDEMSSWVQANGLDQRDVQYALELIRLVKNEPAKAYEKLQPMISRVRQAVGDELPADLQDQLDKGEITEAAAKELAQRRAGDAFSRQRNSREAAAREAARTQEQIEQHAGTIGAAVSEWERGWQKRDPDYAKKQRFVSAEIARLMQEEGVPQSKEDAVALSKRALENVDKEFGGILPAPRALNPATGGAAPRSQAAPRTSLEAAQQGLAKGQKAA